MGARTMTPTPPPGFALLAPPSNTPEPPPGFSIMGNGDEDARSPEQRAADERVSKEGIPGGAGVRVWNKGIPVLGSVLDETVAGIQAGKHALTGGAWGMPYDEALELERARDRAAEKEFSGAGGVALKIGAGLASAPMLPFAGGATAVGRIAGGALTGAGYGAAHGFGEGEGGIGNRALSAGAGGVVGGVAGGVLSAAGEGVGAVRRAYANQGRQGAYGSVADDLPNGVDTLADEIAAGGSRNNITTNRRTLDILGEEMERAGGDVQRAQAATVARIAQEAGVTPQTAAGHIRRLTAVHEDSPLMLAEYPAVSGSDAAQRLRQPGNVDLDELGRAEKSTTQFTLDYLANNGNARSAIEARNAIGRRGEQLAPAMRDTLEEISPQIQTGPRTGRPAGIVDAEQMIANARQLAQQDYAAAYNTPTVQSPGYVNMPGMLQYYRTVASTRAPEVAAAINRAVDQLEVTLPNGHRGVQSLRQLQEGRTTIRGQIQSYRAAGRNDLAAALQPIYERTTRVLESMSPAWAQANRRWADMQFDLVAAELGDAFATKAGPRFREQMREFQGLDPRAQNIVRVHFLQQLFDKLDNLGDTHSVSKLFSNDHARNMIRQLFGNEAAITFTRAVRNQKVAEASQRMMSNSATHRRGVAQKQKDAETGLVAAVENANVRGITNWLLERATQVFTERRNRPMGEILTTPMSDTATVARHVHNMRQQQERLRALDAGRNRQPRSIPFIGAQLGDLTAQDGE